MSTLPKSIVEVQHINAQKAYQLRQVRALKPSLVWVQRGHKLVRDGQTQLTIDRRVVLLWPARRLLEITNMPDGTRYQAQVISLSDAILDMFFQQYPTSPVAHTAPDLSSPYLALCTPHVASAWQRVVALMPHDETQTPHALLQHCVHEILLCLSLSGADLSVLYPTQTIQSWAAHVQQAILLHPEQEWTVDKLAAQLNQGASTLRRKLAQEGQSFRQLLEETRLACALTHLQNSHHPIGEISARCGYISASRFAVRFRQRYGLSPRQVRNTLPKDLPHNLLHR